MQIFADIQQLIVVFLGLLAVGVEVYALAHAARQRPDAFVAAGKKTKTFWLAALGIGLLVGLATFFNTLSLFGLIGVVIAGIYLGDVKPAIEQVIGRSQRGHGRW